MKHEADSKGFLATVGMFDGFHRGHQWLVDRLNARASELGLSPLVLTFDRHPLSVLRPDKAPSLLSPLPVRISRIAEACNGQVATLPFTRDFAAMGAATFLRMIADKYDVKAFAMGFNNHIGSDRMDCESASALGIMPFVSFEACPAEAVSSSEVRSCLISGDVEAAARLLGGHYTIYGNIVDGKHIGRSIGFPTANIDPTEPLQLVPAEGVYAVDVLIANETVSYRGMLNIGRRPTVDKSAAPARTVEVHILDIDKDIYGKEIELSFLKRIRDERGFDSLEALASQLTLDREAVAAIPNNIEAAKA